jgi:hydroxyethylthiazole kinase
MITMKLKTYNINLQCARPEHYGTLNERTIQSMIKAGKKANGLHHTVILDPVGAAGLRAYHAFLIDAISNMNWKVLKNGMKIT